MDEILRIEYAVAEAISWVQEIIEASTVDEDDLDQVNAHLIQAENVADDLSTDTDSEAKPSVYWQSVYDVGQQIQAIRCDASRVQKPEAFLEIKNRLLVVLEPISSELEKAREYAKAMSDLCDSPY